MKRLDVRRKSPYATNLRRSIAKVGAKTSSEANRQAIADCELLVFAHNKARIRRTLQAK